MAACGLLAWLAHRPLQDLIYFAFYNQNYVLGASSFKPSFGPLLNHTWSLAVEEQFYLLWPLVVYLSTARQFARICLGLLPCALLYRLSLALLDPSHIDMVYTGLLSAVDHLAAGGWVAAWMRRGQNQQRMLPTARWVFFPCLALLGFGIALNGPSSTEHYHQAWGHLLFALLPPLLASGLAYVVLHPQGKLARLLCLAPLRYIGKVSYGLYLYHWPLHLVLGRWLDAHGLALAIPCKLLVTFGLAAASWKWVETPLIALKKRFQTRPHTLELAKAADQLIAIK